MTLLYIGIKFRSHACTCVDVHHIHVLAGEGAREEGVYAYFSAMLSKLVLLDI